jgi:hypothetical protein
MFNKLLKSKQYISLYKEDPWGNIIWKSNKLSFLVLKKLYKYINNLMKNNWFVQSKVFPPESTQLFKTNNKSWFFYNLLYVNLKTKQQYLFWIPYIYFFKFKRYLNTFFFSWKKRTKENRIKIPKIVLKNKKVLNFNLYRFVPFGNIAKLNLSFLNNLIYLNLFNWNENSYFNFDKLEKYEIKLKKFVLIFFKFFNLNKLKYTKKIISQTRKLLITQFYYTNINSHILISMLNWQNSKILISNFK